MHDYVISDCIIKVIILRILVVTIDLFAPFIQRFLFFFHAIGEATAGGGGLEGAIVYEESQSPFTITNSQADVNYNWKIASLPQIVTIKRLIMLSKKKNSFGLFLRHVFTI